MKPPNPKPKDIITWVAALVQVCNTFNFSQLLVKNSFIPIPLQDNVAPRNNSKSKAKHDNIPTIYR